MVEVVRYGRIKKWAQERVRHHLFQKTQHNIVPLKNIHQSHPVLSLLSSSSGQYIGPTSPTTA